MKLVIDASVAIKWILREAPDEQDVESALELLADIETGGHEVSQPPHWTVEVLAVLARRAPSEVSGALTVLRGLGGVIDIDDQTYLRASNLSDRLKQHMFDTLYHAVALERGATLVTADDRYFNAVAQEGAIVRLHDFKTR